jgi:hypothetical protein
MNNCFAWSKTRVAGLPMLTAVESVNMANIHASLSTRLRLLKRKGSRNKKFQV